MWTKESYSAKYKKLCEKQWFYSIEPLLCRLNQIDFVFLLNEERVRNDNTNASKRHIRPIQTLWPGNKDLHRTTVVWFEILLSRASLSAALSTTAGNGRSDLRGRREVSPDSEPVREALTSRWVTGLARSLESWWQLRRHPGRSFWRRCRSRGGVRRYPMRPQSSLGITDAHQNGLHYFDACLRKSVTVMVSRARGDVLESRLGCRRAELDGVELWPVTVYSRLLVAPFFHKFGA